MNVVNIKFIGFASFLHLLSGVLLLLGLPAMAQQKFTTVISSKEIGRDDYVQIEFIAENAKQIEHLTPPSFPDFHVVEGPMQSSGMSVVNGSMTQYQGVSFILQPIKTGKFTIEGATAEIDGKQMKSNTVTVEVGVASSGNSASVHPMFLPPSPREPDLGDKDYILKPGENVVDKIKKNLFVKVQVDKNTCYVGEPIVATYKLYSSIRSESRVMKHPSLNGFSVYDMVDPNTDAPSVETINGKRFTVHIIRKAQLIPLQPGPVELDGVEVDNTVHFLKQSARHRPANSILQDLLDQMSDDNGGDEVQQQITLSSKPVTITVKPLPETNKPNDYNGAVGQFDIAAELENKNISSEDAATLKVTIHGSGNLPVVDAPSVKWPAGLDVYNNTAKENIDRTVVPMKGSKSFEYVFTPKHAGSFTIPPIDFSYFDPVRNAYRKLETAPVPFDVIQTKRRPTSSLLKNLLALQPDHSVTQEVRTFLLEHLEWLFVALILMIVAFYLWRHNKITSRLEAERQQKAMEIEKLKKVQEIPVLPVPELVDPLNRARRMLASEDYRHLYSELNRVLWEALTAKFDLPASQLNKQHITLQLKARGWEEEEIETLQQIFNQCEMNLYTPGYHAGDVQNLLEKSAQMIKYINQV